MDIRHLVDIGLAPSSILAASGQAGSPERGGSAPKEAVPKKVSPPKADQSGKPKPVDKVPTPSAPAPASAEKATVAPMSCERTKALWLEDSYKFEATATVLAVVETEKGLTVALDQTIFHPQGGGQPTDVGQLESTSLPHPLPIVFVSMDRETGIVKHDCASADVAVIAAWRDAAEKGVVVTCKVDEATRRRAARCHSAGHLLDAAVAQSGYDWVPGKGYHFMDGAYVEYILNDAAKSAMKDQALKADALAKIQARITALLAEGGEGRVEYDDKGMRIVHIGPNQCPCGGTHVKLVADIGPVTVKALKIKNGNMRVSYSIEA